MGRKIDPNRIVLGELTATPMRDRGTNEQDQRYWRVRLRGGDRRTIWAGWASRAEVEIEMAAQVKAGIPARRELPEVARTVGDLLKRWTAHQVERHAAGQIAARSLDKYGLLDG